MPRSQQSQFSSPDYTDESGSVFDKDGRVIHFSTERLLDVVQNQAHCFVCGTALTQQTHSKEHVFPQWLLRRFDLYSQKINLPNNTSQTYSRYTVPCCKACNNLLSSTLETPISKAFDQGRIEHYIQENTANFYSWLALIYFKMHLRDMKLRASQDSRIEGPMLGQHYDWSKLHYISCIARAPATGLILDQTAVGSAFVFTDQYMPTQGDSERVYDFVSIHSTHTFYLRLDRIHIFHSLADGGGGWGPLKEVFPLIREPKIVQLREIVARMSYCVSRLENPPTFRTGFRPQGSFLIGQREPHPRFSPHNPAVLGQHMEYALPDSLLALFDSDTQQHIIQGNWTCLKDGSGKWLALSADDWA